MRINHSAHVSSHFSGSSLTHFREKTTALKDKIHEFFHQFQSAIHNSFVSLHLPRASVGIPESLKTKIRPITNFLANCNPFHKEDITVPLDTQLTMKKLENGLTYYVRKNDYPYPEKAYLRLVIKVGMLNETPEEKGIAHLVEHIAQIETAAFAKGEIMEYLKSKGVVWGMDSNAHTTPEETLYKLDIPLDDPETLEKCLFILSEVAGKAVLSDDVVDGEREIVIDELTQRRTGWTRFANARRAIQCEDTPYATIVDRDREIQSIRECPGDVVRGFYKRWYQPDNMAVIAVGDFDPKKTSELIEKHFGKIPPSTFPPSEHSHKVKAYTDSRFLCFTDPEITNSYVDIFHLLPIMQGANRIENKLRSLKNTLFKNILKDRLYNLTEQDNSPFIQTSCTKDEIIPDNPFLCLGALTKEGRVAEGFKTLLLEIKRIKTHGFLPSEFDHAKKTLLADIDHDIRETGQTSSKAFVDLYHSHFTEDVLTIDLDKIALVDKRLLEKITLKDLNAIAADLLPESNRIISTATPEKPDLEPVTEEDLKREIAQVQAEDVKQLVDDTANLVLMKRLPKPGKIQATKYHKRADITEYVLNNGMRVFFKPTTLKNDEVVLRMNSIGGIKNADISKISSAKFSNNFFSSFGIGDLDLKQLKKVLNQKNINLGSSIDYNTTSATSTCVPENLESSFQLLHLMFTNPGYNEAGFNRSLENAKEILLNVERDPSDIFAKEYLSTVTQDHPIFRAITLDHLEQTNYEDCKEFHKSRFTNPADFNVAIVGNANPRKVRKYVERYFASLPKTEIRSSANYSPVPFPLGITRKNVYAGKETSCRSLIVFPAPINDTLRERVLSVWCCNLLQQRLNKVLRFEMGKTYTQGCSFQNTSIPGINPHDASTALISLTCDASNQSDLEKAMIEQIQDMQTNGPTESEIADIKTSISKSCVDSRKSNYSWRDQILIKALWNRQQDAFDDYEKEIETLTSNEAKAQFNKIFHLDNYAVVTLFPKPETEEAESHKTTEAAMK